MTGSLAIKYRLVLNWTLWNAVVGNGQFIPTGNRSKLANEIICMMMCRNILYLFHNNFSIPIFSATKPAGLDYPQFHFLLTVS